MPARILVFLPPSTRTCLFMDSKNIGFHSSWSLRNRHVPMLTFCLCCRWSPLLIQIDILCRPIGFSYHIFLTNFQLHHLHCCCTMKVIVQGLFHLIHHTALYSCLFSLIFSIIFHSIPPNKPVRSSLLLTENDAKAHFQAPC